ncbi:hypothetical protein BU17DRAFT_78577 [Hysterangium stoloniferum]|nr:hypothetical protein BU17DRAFT_78577 [Hysterangium stoloniferum]
MSGRWRQPTYPQLTVVATDAVGTLRGLGIECCLMGSMACKLYGTSRRPNDIDVLCLNSPYDQESLKKRLTQANTRFYLVPAKDPAATYKVLWYRLREVGYHVNIKVDLLYPGILDIPNIPVSEIDTNNIHGLPCLPLSHLLLLKLQGWVHHGESTRGFERMKQPADVQDINDLLRISRRRNIRPGDDPHIPIPFKTISETRVLQYVVKRPESESDWTELGFSPHPQEHYDTF